MMTALYSLLAVHWIFNIQYHEKLLELFTYIEDNVLRFPYQKRRKVLNGHLTIVLLQQLLAT